MWPKEIRNVSSPFFLDMKTSQLNDNKDLKRDKESGKGMNCIIWIMPGCTCSHLESQMIYIQEILSRPGYKVYNVVNASDPKNLKIEYTKYETDRLDLTDIAVCLDHVFMTVRDMENPQNSVLRVYKYYDKSRAEPMELVQEYSGIVMFYVYFTFAFVFVVV